MIKIKINKMKYSKTIKWGFHFFNFFNVSNFPLGQPFFATPCRTAKYFSNNSHKKWKESFSCEYVLNNRIQVIQEEYWQQ